MIKILIGSRTDYNVISKALDVEKFFFDKPTIDISVGSAHRSPKRLHELIKNAEESGCKVFIACAGGAAHLAGVIASMTILPVIGVPMKTDMSGGLDSLLSTIQMPSGIPVATVSVNGIENAVVLAVQMLALENPELKEKLVKYKEMLSDRVVEQDILINE